MRGSDATIQALSGLMQGIGQPEGPPMIPPGFQAQIIGGLSAFNGALGHLLAQRMGNRCDPFQLDASILEANMCFTDLAINAYLGNPLPPRMGINPSRPYPLGIWPLRTAGNPSHESMPGNGRPFASCWNWNTLPTLSCFKAALVDWSRPIFLNRKYWLHYPITVPRTCSTADRPYVFL